MKKIFCLAAAAALMSVQGIAYGQTGLLFSQSELNPTDILRMSYQGTYYSTARGAAMGGAFTAIGADLTSLHTNPAGLGMYRSSEFSVTPMVTISKVRNSEPVYVRDGNNTKNRFSLANTGAALNLYQGSGSLTSFTFGFGYNRLVDFNMTNKMDFGQNPSKIADVFIMQVNGLPTGDVDDFRRLHISEWGAGLAYQTYLIDDIPGSNKQYRSNAVADNANVYQSAQVNQRGSVGEYNISGGFNFQNKLYLGFSIGVQDIWYKQTILYDERYENNTGANGVAPATHMYYDISSKMNGSGVNFKMGLIYRPVDQFRIGFAVHTPTYTNITHTYSAYMDTRYVDGRETYGTPDDRYDYDFSTPARIMGGLSYTFGDMGLISVDYERAWYNSMRYKTDDDYRYGFNSDVKYLYKGNNTVRVGAEVRPLNIVSLRAGFTYTDSMVDIDLAKETYSSPVPKQNISGSFGLGFALGRGASLDLAYIYNQTRYTDYYMYHYLFSDGTFLGSGNPTQKVNRSTILATLGFRF